MEKKLIQLERMIRWRNRLVRHINYVNRLVAIDRKYNQDIDIFINR